MTPPSALVPLSDPDMLEVGNLKTYEENRAHFGAWCIVSSPLILGHDVTNEATTSAIWDIITNTEAIAVNQQWAGHPGQFVRSVQPPSPPSPPPRYGSFAYAVPCNSSDETQHGWTYNAKTRTITGPRGLCLDSSNRSQLALHTCSGSDAQTFFYASGAAGQYAEVFGSDNKSCVDVWEGEGSPGGPQVQLFGSCHQGRNELFTFEDGHLKDQENMCLASREDLPPPIAGPSVVQLWAKPQPHGAVAALVLSSQTGQPNATFTVQLAELGLSGTVTVRDIWAHADLGTATASFTTDAFGGHDSRFYLFSPA